MNKMTNNNTEIVVDLQMIAAAVHLVKKKKNGKVNVIIILYFFRTNCIEYNTTTIGQWKYMHYYHFLKIVKYIFRNICKEFAASCCDSWCEVNDWFDNNELSLIIDYWYWYWFQYNEKWWRCANAARNATTSFRLVSCSIPDFDFFGFFLQEFNIYRPPLLDINVNNLMLMVLYCLWIYYRID